MSRRAGGLHGPPVLKAIRYAAVFLLPPNAPTLSGVAPVCPVKWLQSCKTMMPKGACPGAEAWARFQQGRPGSLLGPQSAAPDASGTVMPVWHDSRLHKVLNIRQRQCLRLLLHVV